MRPLFLWRNKIQDCNYNTTILHFGYISQNSLITIVYY